MLTILAILPYRSYQNPIEILTFFFFNCGAVNNNSSLTLADNNKVKIHASKSYNALYKYER